MQTFFPCSNPPCDQGLETLKHEFALRPSSVRGVGGRVATSARAPRTTTPFFGGGSAVQLRLDVEDDPGDRVVVGGIRRELDLGERDSSKGDDDESSRCGDAGKVFHWDFLSRWREY